MKNFQFLNARQPEDAKRLAEEIIELNNRQIKEREEDNKRLQSYLDWLKEEGEL